MKKIFGITAMAALAILLTLAAVTLLVQASIRVSLMTNPALRMLAGAAELVLGIVLLLGTAYLATRIAVRIFGSQPPSG